MYINHNQMATQVANTLTSNYGKLSTSVQRLSTGLRVNSAADDAAGLAIRELMRTDIAALQQGVRNANDAISLIQTADGALSVIDEKLIRMKELAEQAIQLAGAIESLPVRQLTEDQVCAWERVRTTIDLREPPNLKTLVSKCEWEQAVADGHPNHVARPGWLSQLHMHFF